MNATRIIADLFAFAKRSKQLSTCQLEVRTGLNDYGTPVYDPPIDFDAMWLAERQRVRNDRGEEVTARGRLVVPAGTTISEQDRLNLPDGTTPLVIALNRANDRNAFPYVEVFF